MKRRRLCKANMMDPDVDTPVLLVARHVLMATYQCSATKHVTALVATDIYSNVPLERWHRPAVTVRLPSGAEIYVDSITLQALGTKRAFYSYVRTRLELAKHISLYMRFIGCRNPREWKEHEVGCGDTDCFYYLLGSILLAIVHP